MSNGWCDYLGGYPERDHTCSEKLGVTFQKKPADGRMSNIAFIKDPDGYWIEIV